MQWGAILLYFYVPMFPWKDFLMGQIRKILKHQGGKGQISKIQKKTRRKEWREKKRRDFIFYFFYFFYVGGGSHTHVFSISQESPQATTALMRPSLSRTHSYGKLPYNIKYTVLRRN
jgi:hypothetical protein